MALLPTILLWFIVTTASAQKSEPYSNGMLDMEDNAVDDMLSKCTEKTAKKVIDVYFPREIQSSLFREAWQNAEACAVEKLKNAHKRLNKNHTQALCAYTDVYIHEILNNELKGGAAKYSTELFPYHALYFWITYAVQILKKKPCETTYRRSKLDYYGNKGDVMRFGYFASSSRLTDRIGFGVKTCFHIRTCYGAYIKDYSKFPSEEEVLILPYEKFKIKDIVTGPYGELQNCAKTFVLESVGTQSNLNCKALNHSQAIRANYGFIVVVQLFLGLVLYNLSFSKN